MKFAYLIEPPFNYVDENNRVTGCDVELAQTVLEKIGIKQLELIETEFSQLLPGVKQGKWQMTTGLFATEERYQTASFSQPIWALPDGLLVAKGNPMKLTGYASIAQNQHCTLAVIRDQFQHRSAIEYGVPDSRIKLFETYTEAATAVSIGTVDAYASVAQAHKGYLQHNDTLTLDIVVVPSQEKAPAFGCFAFNKADNELRESIDDELSRYLGSAHHRSMMRGFGFTDKEVDLVSLTNL